MSVLALATARDLIDQAMAHATEQFKKPVCVSVCDASGLLVAFVRQEGSPVRSVALSQGKAYSAARMGITTQAVLERMHREKIEIGYFCDPLLTALPGATPLKDKSGALVGAIGVSGLTSAEDQQVTDHVAAKFSA